MNNRVWLTALLALLNFILSHQISAQIRFLSPKVEIVFEHLTVEDGLSSASVGAIFQDRRGYIWFGTYNGVDRYDGYKITSFKYPGDSLVIRNEFPGSVCEDDDGNIWIANHNGGLEMLNPMTHSFTNYLPNPLQSKNDWSNLVLCIYYDINSTLWIGTGNGFYRYDKESRKFIAFKHEAENPYSLGHNSVNAIYEDRRGELWLATGGGLERFDRRTNKFFHYWHYPNNGWGERGTAKYWLLSIFEDDSDIIWSGTDDGLLEFDRKEGSFKHYVNSTKNTSNIPYNTILSICEMDENTLLLATKAGLGLFNKNSKTFYYQVPDKINPHSLSSDQLTSIVKDKSGSIWISTTYGGINKISLSNTKFKKLIYNPYLDVTLSSANVLDLYEGTRNTIWVSTETGLEIFERETDTFTKINFYLKNSAVFQDRFGNIFVSPNIGGLYKLEQNHDWKCIIDSSRKSYSDRITTCYHSNNNKLWIGTLTGDLFLLDLTNFSRKWITKSSNYITNIYEDTFGLLWFGGITTGLFCYDSEKDTIYQFFSDPMKLSALDDNSILVIFEDNQKNIWIGTNKGLQKLNRDDYTFERVKEKDNFFAEGVRQILEDVHHNFWISTRKGISKFNPSTKQSLNFYSVSEFDGIDFFIRVGCKTKDGEMFFGGSKGFVHFYPDSIEEIKFIPPIVITEFRLFEQSIAIDTSIELSYKDNFLSFEFAALSYANNKENQYAYKMEGVDKEWIYCGTRRYVSYPNLEPGDYIFRVKGSTSNRIWNEAGTSINIKINPPWWKNNLAYTLYILLILSSIYFIWRLQLKRIKIRHDYELSRFESQKLHEVDKIKSRFFANISHEFRTPLTLILGPAKRILEGANDSNSKSDADLIHRSAKKLNRLVDELLDISKIEAGEMKLLASSVNIVRLLKDIAMPFFSLAERKKIMFTIETQLDDLIVYIDKPKFEKILNNVLSNAFKFTPERGKVLVSIKLEPPSFPPLVKGELKRDFAEISIRDSGIGIPQDQLDKIFDRFYQVDSSHTRRHEGTGIGLSLTKELIELHKGKIEVESEEGKGSTFHLLFPLGKEHLKAEEICHEEKDDDKDEDKDKTKEWINLETSDINLLSGDDNLTYERYENESLPTLLIVEDNQDVRKYISTIIENQYKIYEARDGVEGLEISIKNIPDLIISDIMMPKMDGFQLCSKLKNDERTSHIPIIMLTAKATMHDKVSGLELGADDYIMKPFEAEELNARIKNLLVQRKRLHEHFRKFGLIEYEEKYLKSADKKFLNQAVAVINEHLSDASFGVESFAEQMSISKSLLLKKINALFGEPPSDFIKRIRLDRAANLLKNNNVSISEIAFEVGFTNPSYFAECFKKQFGVSPSQYHQKP